MINMKDLSRVKKIRHIKDSTVVRFLLKPIKDLDNKRILRYYRKSGEGKRLAEFHSRYEGETCFIIGNGPSLLVEDLDRLKDRYTFGANMIFTLYDKTEWRPTFYSCMDTEAIRIFGDDFLKIEADYKFFKIEAKIKSGATSIPENIYFFYNSLPFNVRRYASTHPFISEDITKCISDSKTVTFTNIQLAIYMGFRRIVLLGVDHNYGRILHRNGIIEETGNTTYAKGMKDLGMGIQYLDSTTEGYEAARDYCDKHDIEILNATRGGKLEVFRRVDIEDFL